MVTALIASYVAIVGLYTWKAQLKGKENYDLARRCLRSLYLIRDAFDFFRHPYMSPSEIYTALKEYYPDALENISRPGNRANETDAVLKTRWRKIQEAYSTYHVEVIEAEALWGEDVKAVMEKIRPIVSQIYGAMDLYIQDLYSNGRVLGDARTRYEAIVFKQPEDDELKMEIDGTVKEIENIIRPYLTLIHKTKGWPENNFSEL